MTNSKDARNVAGKGVKKLALKKETVKDLDSAPRKGEGLRDDQLDAVHGGVAQLPEAGPRSRAGAGGPQCRLTQKSYRCP